MKKVGKMHIFLQLVKTKSKKYAYFFPKMQKKAENEKNFACGTHLIKNLIWG